MDEQKQNAPVYDDRGNVRPTDARYAGRDRVQLTSQELAAIREQEIADATERLRQDQAKLQAENDKRLEDAVASVSPAPATATADTDGAETETDEYDGMQYAELQQEAKARELNAGGSADDLRARLREYDAKVADEITGA